MAVASQDTVNKAAGGGPGGGDPSPTDTPGCSVHSTGYRVDQNKNDVNLGSGFKILKTVTGEGRLMSFTVRFDTSQTEIKLRIDGAEKFTIDSKELIDAAFEDPALDGRGPFGVKGDTFVFQPSKCSLYFSQSFQVEAKADSKKAMYQNYEYELV